MTSPERQQRIAALRDTIADIERKPALAEARQRVEAEDGQFPKLAGGLMQEVFTDDRRNVGASLGFALGQARELLTGKRMAIIYLQLADEAQKLGLPYGPGLLSFGLDPAALILVRPTTMVELLWAAEEAIACKAVAAVVADIAGHQKLLDFKASRRLSLRAAEAGSSIFLLRYGTRREASAAHLRWHLMPSQSSRQRYDDKAPGSARWWATLERGTVFKRSADWLLGWTEDGFATFPAVQQQPTGPKISQSFPAQLADRLPQTA